MEIKPFFDRATFTLTYVVFDDKTRDAVILDPVLDFDPASGRITTTSVTEVIEFIKASRLHVRMILETHAHADHLSSSQYLKKIFPDAKLGINQEITKVQEVFRKVYALPESFPVDGSQFDFLLHDGEDAKAGSLTFKVMNTPGHTPACTTFNFQGHLFTGDALFMPDYGVGRTDFPGGSATDLYHSVQKIYSLGDHLKVFTGHDYLPGGRDVRYESTVGEQKRTNVHLQQNTTLTQFVEMRVARDKTLAAPRLLHPSVQVNIAAGKVPFRGENGKPFIHIPLSGDIP